MCDKEREMLADLKEGRKDIAFTLTLARSEVLAVRRTIAKALGKPDLPKAHLSNLYRQVVNS